MKCVACGGELAAPVATDVPYLSLPGVTLCGIPVRTCVKCGESEIEIPMIDELDQELARLVADRPGRLDGGEVRFLRQVVGWSSKDFAKLVGVAPESVSRWENDHEPIGAQSERLLRVLVKGRLAPITDYDAFERWLEGLDQRASTRDIHMTIRHSDKQGWLPGACA